MDFVRSRPSGWSRYRLWSIRYLGDPRDEGDVMKAASMDSKRLQRVAKYLSDGQEHTTLDIVSGAQVCAVNSIIAELRANGHEIKCQRRGDRWFYRMQKITLQPARA